ncbi:efflux RND transporter permease subunit [Raineya orbicola]|uniref:Cation/multidrug efflux pump n=1 Tax=Raineya orbicola TaxID=2016530 RepID=A0A2N3IIG9_9BACT|nr:efflux RND transporter permease subunit [Raineya orbicola]PKQ70023.1 Cation/multidrug efflux pump [Raineya orbicola]
MNHKIKEFFASSWAIDNKTVIYAITIFLVIAGLYSYEKIPKEQFPDIVVPTIYVQNTYVGASPKDMENLVTKPIEDELKSVKDIKKVTSNSVESFSSIIVEFGTNVSVAEAKQRVKDAVDKAKPKLPNSSLRKEPVIQEIDFSEFPIMYVNISGDFGLDRLKKYAELLEEKIEGFPEIRRVDIIGALDREIQINVDKYKMEAATISFGDIERALSSENVTIPGGTIQIDGVRRSVNISGQFKDVETIKNLVVGSGLGGNIYLKDIAEVKDGFKEQESFARMNGKPVVTLSVIKKGGENLISAADKIKELVAQMQADSKLPSALAVDFTGDQSKNTRITLHDLINTIIIGFILVTVILMFFMGATNAMFVAASVPLSVALAFLIFPTIGFTLNFIVLFAFLLALGIVVDDAIVVIENTHRIFDNGKVPIKKAAKEAAGEVFLPVLSGTATTLAPFVPLAFWPGIIGKFMYFLPVTLIITLLASLVIAYTINPVFAVDFMKPHRDHSKKPEGTFYQRNKGMISVGVIFAIFAAIFYASGFFGMANFTLTLFALFLLNRFLLSKIIYRFQNKTWPSVQNAYKRLLSWTLVGKRPALLMLGAVGLFIISIVALILRKPTIEFFPQAEPNFVYVYASLPIGTDQNYTDSVMKVLEKRVNSVIYPDNKPNPLVTSVITNVTIGASEDQNDRSPTPHKGKIQVAFVEFAKRNGQSTQVYMDKIREEINKLDLPHTIKIAVEKERNGPPTGKPIAIEIMGEELDELILVGDSLQKFLENQQIAGVEKLQSDIQKNKPQLRVVIDRERALREGLFTGQIGSEVSTAILGREVSKFKEGEDEYPIMLRYTKEQRDNLAALINHKITFRDMAKGGVLRQVPISAVAELKYDNTFGGIKRKNQKKIITISSNILFGFNPAAVVKDVEDQIAIFKDKYNVPEGITIRMGGEQEQQKETSAFLGLAMLISVALILITLLLQFNSISKTFIILLQIVFSVIGVLLGLAITGMKISIVMTGIGIVALAGIVVRNGILLVEFTDILRERGLPIKQAIVEAGKDRMTPVLMTATATILGLIPLAVGLNIDFAKLFSEGNPNIFFGGDSVAFWGPLAWTMIYGLTFATILTLVLVPLMYWIAQNWKMRLQKFFGKKELETPLSSNGSLHKEETEVEALR